MVNLDLPILNRVKNILTKTEKIDTDVTSVLTKLAEQGVDIDSIIKSIGTSGDQASAATIFGKLAGLASQCGGAVKSVQRGVAKYNRGSAVSDPFGATMTINISTVNPSKVLVILREQYDRNEYIERSVIFQRASLESVSANNIKVHPSSYVDNFNKDFGSPFSWQVIEFY